MTILQRFGYYLGGFSIGLVILAFFLNGKRASCDYTPNARTIKSISLKKQQISETAQRQMQELNLDTLDIKTLVLKGDVDFSESDIQSDACNMYVIESFKDPHEYLMKIEYCDSTSTLKSIVTMSDN